MTDQSSPKFRHYILLVIGIIVIVGWAWMHYFPGESPVLPVVTPETTQVIEPAEGTDAAPSEPEPKKEPQQSAKRIVHVPSPPADFTNYDEQVTQVSSDNVLKLTTSLLESALEGELAAAVSLRRLRWLCGVDKESEAINQFELDNVMARASYLGSQVSTEGSAITLTGGEGISIMIYPTENQNREYLFQWGEQCGHVRSLFDDDLRKRLEQLARDGHVMARFLYASWKPSMNFEAGVFEKITEWHLNAVDFSYANLAERELAGLVALGESYVFGGFTGNKYIFGMLLMEAALNCGLESSIWERRLSGMRRMKSRMDETVDEAEAFLIELKAYCE